MVSLLPRVLCQQTKTLDDFGVPVDSPHLHSKSVVYAVRQSPNSRPLLGLLTQAGLNLWPEPDTVRLFPVFIPYLKKTSCFSPIFLSLGPLKTETSHFLEC